MEKEEESTSGWENHQAEDLSAKMARKSKPIPPPLNLTPVGESEPSSSPLKDFAMLATSPRSPLVQKNLPFRKRAHSYSSTQTSSECDSPESPRIPASPLAKEPPAPPSPSPCPLMKSPLSSPTAHFFNKKFLEPIKSLLPSPNTSASFFNNECDPIKSPMASLSFFRPSSDLLSIPMMEKNSIKSPLTTPTRSVFLQNHLDSTLFFTDIDKLPLKSPLNTPTRSGFLQNTPSHDIFVMPEPISIKQEPNESQIDSRLEAEKLPSSNYSQDIVKIQRDLTKLRNEKENIADLQYTSSDPIKHEPLEIDFTDKTIRPEVYDIRSPYIQNSNDLCTIKIEKDDNSTSSSFGQYDTNITPLLPLDCHKNNYMSDFDIKKESSNSPCRTENFDRSRPSSSDLMIGSHLDNNRLVETFTQNKVHFSKGFLQQNFGYTSSPSSYTTHVTDTYSSSSNSFSNSPQLQDYSQTNAARKNPATYNKPHTYNKNKNVQNVLKRNITDKNDEEGIKKSKKDQNDERPRRPMNAFMLFAKHQRPLLIQQHPGKDNRAISVVLGTAWRELEENERADYVRRAAVMASEHKKRHPDCWKRRRVRVPNNQTNNVNNIPNSAVTTS